MSRTESRLVNMDGVSASVVGVFTALLFSLYLGPLAMTVPHHRINTPDPGSSAQIMALDLDVLQISIRRNSAFYLGANVVRSSDFAPMVREVRSRRPSATVVLEADRHISYGRLEVMLSALREAGVESVFLRSGPYQSVLEIRSRTPGT